MFTSIVTGFDGSAHARRALEMAITLAARYKARLGIVYVVDLSQMAIPLGLKQMSEAEHVIEPVPKMLQNFEATPPQIVSSMMENAAASERGLYEFAEFILGEARDSANEAKIQHINTRVLVGNPAEQIISYATSREADLIVVGRRGFGTLKSLVLGSTSSKVAHLSDTACLTVK